MFCAQDLTSCFNLLDCVVAIAKVLNDLLDFAAFQIF